MAPSRPLKARVVDQLVRCADAVVPHRDLVAVHSSPDLDDNVVALLRDVPADLTVVVLAQHAGTAAERAAALGLEVSVVRRYSRQGWWAYLRCRWLISTHGVFGCRPRRRGKQVVGLWHGEFGKRIGSFAGEADRYFDWVPVSSELSRTSRAAEFMLDPARIEVVGSPRQSLLRTPVATTGRTVVWVPTYRTSVTGSIRHDGDPAAIARELPLDDPELDRLLAEHDATLWFRPHPAAEQGVGAMGPRVRRATNDDLEELGVSFYELLGAADCFVTDYSSVWVDFLVLDRPMVAFCPDLDSFRTSRGLALEPHEAWFPGHVVTDRAALLDAVRRALEEPDADREVRNQRRAVLHTSAGIDPVAALWHHVAGLSSS